MPLGALFGSSVGASVVDAALNVWAAGKDREFSEGQSRIQREFSREMFERNAALQREFAKMGIQWKVQDAQAAGLHPLYALGASVPGASAIPALGAAQAESDYQGMARSLSPMLRMQQLMQLQAMRSASKKDDAISAFYDSQTARNLQSMVSGKGLPSVAEGVQVTLPSERVSANLADASVQAGRPSAMYKDYVGPFGLPVRMVEPQLSESLEGVVGDLLKSVFIVGGNVQMLTDAIVRSIKDRYREYVVSPPPPPE